MTGAIIFQLFFPTYMGSHSGYGISIGWQREIGIWNVTVLVILITVNLKYDWFYLKAVLMALIIGGLGIGTNHFLSYLQYRHSVNAIGALENYLLVLGMKIMCLQIQIFQMILLLRLHNLHIQPS